MKKNEGRGCKLSLTLDCWTSKNQYSFLGITVHYIDKNWVIISTLLDFVEVKGSHTGENLAHYLVNVVNDFGISDKIIAITTDNASNNDTLMRSLSEILAKKDIIFQIEWSHVRFAFDFVMSQHRLNGCA